MGLAILTRTVLPKSSDSFYSDKKNILTIIKQIKVFDRVTLSVSACITTILRAAPDLRLLRKPASVLPLIPNLADDTLDCPL